MGPERRTRCSLYRELTAGLVGRGRAGPGRLPCFMPHENKHTSDDPTWECVAHARRFLHQLEPKVGEDEPHFNKNSSPQLLS